MQIEDCKPQDIEPTLIIILCRQRKKDISKQILKK